MDVLLKTGLILGGLLCAAFAWLMAFAMAGAGHGWVAPLFYSTILFVAYPLVFVRMVGVSRNWMALDVALILVAIAADIFLAVGTHRSEARYFALVMREPVLPLMWIATWTIWQAVTAWQLWRDIAGRGPAEAS